MDSELSTAQGFGSTPEPNPVLAKEAVKNVRTWKFADHSPTTFTVTYVYANEGNYKKDPITKCSAKMELPTQVTVSTRF